MNIGADDDPIGRRDIRIGQRVFDPFGALGFNFDFMAHDNRGFPQGSAAMTVWAIPVGHPVTATILAMLTSF